MYDPCLESLICSYCEQTYFDLLQKGALLEENHDASPKTFQIFPINHWLVVWNILYFSIYWEE